MYNSLGQQIALTNSLGTATSYTYNSNGILQTVQNPAGAITTFLSDQVNRLTNVIDELGHVYTYQYDLNRGLVWSPIRSARLVDGVRPERAAVSATDPNGRIRPLATTLPATG